MTEHETDARFAPLPTPKRAASFAWNGRVIEVDLDTKTFHCPNCGMRLYLPHDLIASGGVVETVSPSVICSPQYGGCGWHVVITKGNAV